MEQLEMSVNTGKGRRKQPFLGLGMIVLEMKVSLGR